MQTIPTPQDAETLAKELERPSLIPIAIQKEDIENPAKTYLNIRKKYDYSYLLESIEGPYRSSRYSIIGCRPLLSLEIQNGHRKIRGASDIVNVSRKRVREIERGADPLEILKKAMLMDSMHILSLNLPRYVLGMTGYLSYDFVRAVTDLDSDTVDDLEHPTLEFMLPSLVIVFDHHEQITYHASLMLLTDETDFEEVHSKSLDGLEELTSLNPLQAEDDDGEEVSLSSNFEKEDFEESVRKIREYIHAGDMIQTVLSRRIDLSPSPSLERFYMRLREINPSPYMFFLDFSERTIIGSSPEALVRVQGEKVLTRPIAGTRPRGENEKEDLEMERDLLQDEKERAEHVMLVDLGRNDIGKITKFGSIETPEFMEIEKYGDVQHIVSTVTGELKENTDAFDALRAVFPAGTVTGAPKVRAMEIIEELEPTQRGIYSGAIGSFSYTGDADFAISIRTLTTNDKEAHIQVGAGIVADSIPEKEHQETQNKARSLLRAIGVTNENSSNR